MMFPYQSDIPDIQTRSELSPSIICFLQFGDVQPPTVDEVRKLIDSMPAKSSPIDSIPTSIIKSFSDVFALLIARFATHSFSDGSFPSSYKTASVTPLLKKNDLDRDNPANFRPISNLHTISKILERLFLSRFTAHVESSPNFNRFQSAYRRGFSTETAHPPVAQ